jgi:tetratricopeptide (TPR) repeat protein
MLLLATAWHLAGRAQVALLAASFFVMVLLAGGTYSQEGQWRDDTTLFTKAHQLAPHNEPVARNLADTHVRAALLLQEQGRCNEAIPVFREVARNDPQDWYALAGLGYCLVEMNDLVGAEDSLHRAVEISHDPNITQQWQELRAHIGLAVPVGPN